jgi:hypothetical protein
MDAFLSGLPGYIYSHLTDTKLVVKGLREDGVPERIREHFTACVTSVELSKEASVSRASACVNSLRLISETAPNITSTVRRPGLESNNIQAIMEYLDPLCYISNSSTALRASCTRGVVIREFLVSWHHLDAEAILTKKFPDHLMPLYNVIRTWTTTEISQWSHIPSISPPPISDHLPSDRHSAMDR